MMVIYDDARASQPTIIRHIYTSMYTRPYSWLWCVERAVRLGARMWCDFVL